MDAFVESEIRRIFNRQIHKCLERIEKGLSVYQIASIKRSFRFAEKDILEMMEKHNDSKRKANGIAGALWSACCNRSRKAQE